MSVERKVLNDTLQKGEEEDGSIEFKERLMKDVHLKRNKRDSLTAQLRHRILSGNGEATYVVGVSDDGQILGLESDEFSESVDVLSILAAEIDSHIDNVETWTVDDTDRIVGLVVLQDGLEKEPEEDHVIVGTAGHVDHGKSTLIGSIVTGDSDDGEGGTRSYLDVKPHEVDRGLSADLSYAVYGFDENGDEIKMDNPDRDSERSDVVRKSNKLVSFVDTVGHEPWLRTTIRGIVGQKLDYGLLTVAADDGPTKTTKEHLGVLLATELPTIVTITKTDLVSDERVDEVEMEVEALLREANKTPMLMSRYDVDTVIDEMNEQVIPILRTSAVTMQGLDTLDTLFKQLEPRENESGEFKMYIDKVYTVEGVGAVASGTIKSGELDRGDDLLIGPMPNGEFKETRARSIEIHYHDVDHASSGQLVSIALKDLKSEDIERGMVLVDKDSQPEPTQKFEADIMVLNHPTKITDGYEPVIHLETIGEAARIQPHDGNLLPGDTGEATVEFKFSSYYIEEGQKFVFREGQSKGVGTVKTVI